jgi:hypothetical protein
MEYKVGDIVRIVLVDDRYSSSPVYSWYKEMVGKSYTVKVIHDKGVTLDTTSHSYWDFHEIELDKSKIIHDILQEL